MNYKKLTEKEILLIYFAKEGKVLEVQSLLDEGVDINVKTFKGMTPLMLAAKHYQPDVVGLLINSGANLNCCDGNRWTVLHYASKKGWIHIVQSLVSKNFDLDVMTNFGETPIMLAAHFGCSDIVDLLIISGANINIYDENKWSVLHHAAFNGCLTIVKAIVSKGIGVKSINSKDFGGCTPLHLVVRYFGDIETVYFLLKKGADCNIENFWGDSSLGLLAEKQSVGAVRLCIEKGGFVTARNYNSLVKEPLLKSTILQRKKFCILAIINKYNNKDLPAIYKMLASSGLLPCIDKIKIKMGSGAAKEIEIAVTYEIQKNKFCHLIKVQPLVLSMLCVKALLTYIQSIENLRKSSEDLLTYIHNIENLCATKASCSQTVSKRLSIQECSSKKMRLEKSNQEH